MDFTINIVVLFAVILSVGLLVDGAIVVVEYADRKMKEGLSVKDAFANASKKCPYQLFHQLSQPSQPFFHLYSGQV